MSAIRSLRHRVEKLETRRQPAEPPPFHILDQQSPEEIAAIRRDVEDYQRRHPNGPPAFIVELHRFDADRP